MRCTEYKLDINCNTRNNLWSVSVVLAIFIAITFMSDDLKSYGIIVHSIYAVILIAMGMISINTMKFNFNKNSVFIGISFGIIGILEVIYIYIHTVYAIDYTMWLNLILINTISILPVAMIYFSFIYSSKNKNLIIYIIEIVIAIISFNFLLVRLVTSFNITRVGINILDCLVNIVIFGFIYLGLKKSNLTSNKEQLYLNNILKIIAISRVPMVIGLIVGDGYRSYIISQIIVNASVIFIYKYMIYTNVKKPYEEFNSINRNLMKKRENLKTNNERLVRYSEEIKKLKNLILKKESKLRSTLDASINNVVVFDKNKNIIYKNQTFKDTFKNDQKYLKSELRNYDDVLEKIDDILNSGLDTQMIVYTESNVYSATLAPLIIKSKITGVLCILVDKTSEKLFEKNIIEANTRYESFLESIGDGIVVLEEGKKVYVNEACKTIFRNKVDEIDLLFKDITDEREHLYTIDGEDIYVELRFSEYTKCGKNKTIVAVRDITSRKLAQIKLKESQESYSRLMDIIPNGICLLTKNLEINYANQSFLNILGIDNSYDINQINIKQIISMGVEEGYSFEKDLKSVIDKNNHILLPEQELITKSKDKVKVEINALPFVGGESEYIMIIIKDMTNKIDSEKVEKELLDRINTDKIKTEFFANMSHELKTPLNVISSSNQLIDSFYQNGRLKDYNDNIKSHIDLVRQNSYRLQRLINNIIDLTKMESGLYKLRLCKYNIVSIIEDIFMHVEDYAARKDISILFDTELEEIEIYVDKYQIERVILNLLSNCIKFTPNGGRVFLDIYVRDGSVKVSVKDTGVGIPKSKLSSIFEEFTQVDHTLSRNTEGSGIGLTIAKNIVKLHDGKIEVRSEENRGTEFLISIPIKEVKCEDIQGDRSIYNIEEEVKIEFSDIYY